MRVYSKERVEKLNRIYSKSQERVEMRLPNGVQESKSDSNDDEY